MVFFKGWTPHQSGDGKERVKVEAVGEEVALSGGDQAERGGWLGPDPAQCGFAIIDESAVEPELIWYHLINWWLVPTFSKWFYLFKHISSIPEK